MFYILIILGIANGVGSSTAEFRTKEACDFAVSTIQRTNPAHVGICVPKGQPNG